MDSGPVPPQYLTAGDEYLQALKALGLNPDFLGWGWDIPAEEWLLVLVTSIVDAGGPLALNRLLFKAYAAHATPKAVSPFIVRVFSPEIIPDDFWVLNQRNMKLTPAEDAGFTAEIVNARRVFLGVEIEMVNSYETLPRRQMKYQERRKAWEIFKKRVDRLAA